MLHLTESDLRFVVETVATSRRDYDHLLNLVRDKEDLLELMLEDPKLTERLFREEEAFSAYLSTPALLDTPAAGAKGIGEGGVYP